MILKQKLLLYTLKESVPEGGHQLLYLMNGNGSTSNKVRNWSIDTGITWRDVFLNSSSLGLEYPGLETVVEYAYSYVPPEGGLIAGCNPYNNGGGSRDQGGHWRIFGYDGGNFCFDCPSEDDRLQVNGDLVENTVYTETAKYGFLGTNQLSSYLKVESSDSTVEEGTKTNFQFRWYNAQNPYNLYLWSDNSQASYNADTAPRQGVKIYRFTAWYLENGVRHTKIYEGVPWLDANGVPCIKDLVSEQLQYNCASDPLPFLYEEIQ